jgi:hypothetical protein
MENGHKATEWRKHTADRANQFQMQQCLNSFASEGDMAFQDWGEGPWVLDLEGFG